MKSEEELMGWFRDRLVWSDAGVVTDLLKSGLFVRMYTPQVGSKAQNGCCRVSLGALEPVPCTQDHCIAAV